MNATHHYNFQRGRTTDNRWHAPASRSSSSASKKREEHPDSRLREKTASLSPNNVRAYGEDGEIKEMGSEKKKFKVLNALERMGLAQQQKELEEKIKRNPSDANRLKLEKAKLKELESCYQITKDAFAQSQKDLQYSQGDKKRLRAEIDVKDARLEILQKDLDAALRGKREAEQDKQSYRKSYYEKREQVEKVESELKDAKELHTKKLKETNQEWERKNEELQRQLQEAKDALTLLHTEKTVFQSTIEEQEGCMREIGELLQKRFAATATRFA